MATTAKQTIQGSCHCGKITYTISLDKPTPEKPFHAYRCNCTVCQKPGFTAIRIQPDDFNLTSPASKAELPDYQPRSETSHRYFCDKCGVHVWGEGTYSWEGQTHEYFSVNMCTIDQPQEGVDLKDFKLDYYNGLRNAWMDGGKDSPYSGGAV